MYPFPLVIWLFYDASDEAGLAHIDRHLDGLVLEEMAAASHRSSHHQYPCHQYRGNWEQS